MILKTVIPSLTKVDSFCSSKELTLEVGHYLLNGYTVFFSKDERGFSATIDFKPFSGFSSSQLHSIDLPQPIKLSNSTETFFLPENSILLNQQFSDFNEIEPIIKIKGSINHISTSISDFDWTNNYLRFILPVKKNSTSLREVRGYTFNSDVRSENRQLLKVSINKIEFEFFTFCTKANQYLVVDSTTEYDLASFTRISHSILLGLGFLYGDLFMNEGFILSSKDKEFATIDNIQFSTYRETIYSGYRVHTTNAYSVINMTGRTAEEIEQKQQEATSWINDIVEIELDVFSRLCELFFNNEPISRAAIVTLEGNTLALELKGSAYSIALEAITSVIMEENNEKNPKPIPKNKFKSLREDFFRVLDETFPPTVENQTARDIFKNRIDNLNSPTNTSKLQKAFKLVGHELNVYEFEAVNARNKFQHGLLPVTEATENAIFCEVYFICIVMHRLIYTLVLRRIGYEGYIINYPQIHKNITKRDLGEKVFYKVGD